LRHGLYIKGFAAIMGRSEGAQPRVTPVATRWTSSGSTWTEFQKHVL